MEFAPGDLRLLNKISSDEADRRDDTSMEPTSPGGNVEVKYGDATDTSQLTEPAHIAVDPEMKQMLEQMNGRINELVGSQQQKQSASVESGEDNKLSMELFKQIADLQSEIKQERQRSADLDRQNQKELLAEKKRCSSELDDLKQQLNDERSKFAVQEAEYQASQGRWEDEKARKEEALVKTIEELNNLTEENDSLVEHLAEAEDMLKTHKEETEINEQKLKEKIQQLSTQMEQLSVGTDAHKEALQQLEESDRKISRLTEQLQAARNESSASKAHLEKVLGSVSKDEAERRKTMTCLHSSETELAAERVRREQAERTAKEGKEELDSVREQLQAALAKAASVEYELKSVRKESKTRAASLEKEIAQLDETLQQTFTETEEAKKQTLEVQQNAKKEADAVEKEVSAMKEEYEAQVVALERQIDSLNEELEDTKACAITAQERLDALSKEQKTSASARRATMDSLEVANNTLSNERSRREKAENRLVELEKGLYQLTEERDMARANMAGFDQREADLFNKLRVSEDVRRVMHNQIIQLMGNIRVFVRVRPALEGEQEAMRDNLIANAAPAQRKYIEEAVACPFKFPEIYDSGETKSQIVLREPRKDRGGLKDRQRQWKFGFDSVFTPNQGQQEVWEAAEPLIQCTVDGFNVTLFAYGQTGSGKTHTMLGETGNEGIIARAVKKLFDDKIKVEDLSQGKSSVSISVELLEVYNEKVHDLLTSKEVTVTSQEVVGNTLVETSSEDQVLQILQLAQERRCVKSTQSNSESSRSHMIFTIHFTVTLSDGKIREGKLNICDLAGSERVSKSGANQIGGALFEETKHINKSLSTLSNVIEKLQSGEKIIPFRESKLTFLLKDSLCGNSKTLAIICLNPLSSHMSESLSSLRFAEKASRVDLKAVANYSC